MQLFTRVSPNPDSLSYPLSFFSFSPSCRALYCTILTDMTRKDADPDFENPTERQPQAFEALKERMVSQPILALLRYGQLYMIDTDGSSYQLGCTLLQEHEEANDWRSVGYWSYLLSDSERNYSATEGECFAVVCAVRTLRPYVEGTNFTVRTDHDALRWLMSLTESSGILTQWRPRLAEYDFTIQYRPGRVHQVPDALSRPVWPRVTDDPRPVVEVDDDIPTFDAGTTVHDVSNELADHVCTASCDHKAVHVFVTTRNQAGSRRMSRARMHDEPRGDDEAPLLKDPRSSGGRTRNSTRLISRASRQTSSTRPPPRSPHRRKTYRPRLR